MQTFETEHYLLHYGAGTPAERDIEKIAALLNEVLFPDMTTTVLLETMAGKGSEVGGRFEELRAIIDRVELTEHAVHLNNSLNPCGSHKDRHAKLLDGCIPPEALVRVTRHPALAELPFILETPNDDAGYAQEIAWLRAAQN